MASSLKPVTDADPAADAARYHWLIRNARDISFPDGLHDEFVLTVENLNRYIDERMGKF